MRQAGKQALQRLRLHVLLHPQTHAEASRAFWARRGVRAHGHAGGVAAPAGKRNLACARASTTCPLRAHRLMYADCVSTSSCNLRLAGQPACVAHPSRRRWRGIPSPGRPPPTPGRAAPGWSSWACTAAPRALGSTSAPARQTPQSGVAWQLSCCAICGPRAAAAAAPCLASADGRCGSSWAAAAAGWGSRQSTPPAC